MKIRTTQIRKNTANSALPGIGIRAPATGWNP
jgi:hypothetical protein